MSVERIRLAIQTALDALDETAWRRWRGL